MSTPDQHSNFLRDYLSMPGVAALGASAILYTYSSCLGRQAQELSRAEPMSQLADISNVARLLPMLVAIRGRVNSYYAKKCELSDKHAVIHEFLEEEIWRKQRAEGRTTYEPFETRKMFEESEWFVEDGSGLRVKVENALQASHLRTAMEMKTEFEAEDVSNKSIPKVLMEKAWQMTKTGMRRTERYLPVGTVVTCVGELAPNQIHTPASAAPAGTVNPHGSTCQSSFTSTPLHLPSTTTNSSTSSESISGRGSDSGLAPSQKASLWNSQGGGSGMQHGTDGSLSSGPKPGHIGSQGSSQGEESLAYVLRKPVAGPSYITTLSVEQLLAAMSSRSNKCKWAAYALGAVGALLVVRKVILRVLQRLHERRIRQRVQQVEEARRNRILLTRKARGDAAGDLPGSQGATEVFQQEYQEDYNGDREPNTCVICLERDVGTVFTNCGHMCCCVGCGLATSLERCPICRVRGRAIRVFKP